ncbi:polyprenyl synthetase family protein [Melioribacteraceae bacterium 4301-Me]|uniref:polyprenyl synthetase family protein n=1 Tax=Pyranulibacter aquaticus TaxID=3163344 RepID=UPI00359A83C9
MISESDNEKFLNLYKNELVKLELKITRVFEKRLPKSLYQPCKYAIESGGKRIRPFFVLLAAKAAGGNFDQVYNAAIAVELLHNFTLVHDDIMDNSTIRRCRPTLHIKYDVNTAILAGDSLIALAYEYLLKDTPENSKSIIETFTQSVVEVCEGQSLDKEFETRRNVTINDYKKMIYQKTAALLVMSGKIGAQMVTVKKNIIDAISKYAANIGMAFQIQDDLLDITANQNKFGKKIGNDLIEGKKTFLFLKAYEKASGKDKRELNNFIKNKGIPEHKIPVFNEIYERLGVFEDAKNEIKRYTQLGINQLKVFKDKEAKNLLVWFANFLLNRKY